MKLSHAPYVNSASNFEEPPVSLLMLGMCVIVPLHFKIALSLRTINLLKHFCIFLFWRFEVISPRINFIFYEQIVISRQKQRKIPCIGMVQCIIPVETT